MDKQHEVVLMVPRSSKVSVGGTPGEHEQTRRLTGARRRPKAVDNRRRVLPGWIVASSFNLEFIKNIQNRLSMVGGRRLKNTRQREGGQAAAGTQLARTSLNDTKKNFQFKAKSIT
jgi:hypothetical protein